MGYLGIRLKQGGWEYPVRGGTRPGGCVSAQVLTSLIKKKEESATLFEGVKGIIGSIEW